DAGPDFTLHQGFTYSGHPVACAAGLATLDVIEREGLVDKVRRDGPYFAERLATLAELPIVGEIRSIGLMAAIEIVGARSARGPFQRAVPGRTREAARRRGLICRATAEALMLCPPLVTTRQQLDEIVAIVRASIVEVAATLD